MKKLLLAIIMVLQSSISFANLSEGTFSGTVDGKKGSIMLQKVSGRPAYFALITKKEFEAVYLFMIEEFEGNSYSMVPITVTDDNHLIGVNNDDPSLVMDVINSKKDGEFNFKITSANSSNKSAQELVGSVFKTKKESKFSWANLQSGEYIQIGNHDSDDNSPRSIDLTELDLDRESRAQFELKSLSGSYVVSENRSKMFLVRPVSRLATGDQRQKRPEMIGVFINKQGGFMSFAKSYFLLINPHNSTDILTFKLSN
jgi:hypothetical protein